jgi:hypothetical protein
MATSYPSGKTATEVNDDAISIPRSAQASLPDTKEEILEAREIFHDSDEQGVKFRTVSWQRATVIFLKIQFAMSVLAVPGALATLGAVGGALSLLGWIILNTYTAVVLGGFRNRHPECHSEFVLQWLCCCPSDSDSPYSSR